jgi:hypothetical protein
MRATGKQWLLAPFALLAAYAATFAAIYYGVALSAAANRSLEGTTRPPPTVSTWLTSGAG